VALVDGSASILLDGTPSDDGDGGTQELAYAWEKLTGPDGDAIAREFKESTDVTFTQAGEYSYQLTVDDGFDQDTAEVTVTVEGPPPTLFRRGDTNGDSEYNVTDGVYLLNHLFLGNPRTVPCRDALDTDDEGALGVTDAVFLLNYMFLGGTPPPPPFPDCGEDETPAPGLDCEESLCA
jgi:hypothetical protein